MRILTLLRNLGSEPKGWTSASRHPLAPVAGEVDHRTTSADCRPSR